MNTADRICQECGATVAEEDGFCERCGTRFASLTEVSEETRTETPSRSGGYPNANPRLDMKDPVAVRSELVAETPHPTLSQTPSPHPDPGSLRSPRPGWRYHAAGTVYVLGSHLLPKPGYMIWTRDGLRTVGSYPQTASGWARAFLRFAKLEPNHVLLPPGETSTDLIECTYLGGHGLNLELEGRYDLRFGPNGLEIWGAPGSSPTPIPYTEVESLEISGPGEVTEGMQWWGGGFGLEGALKGMLTASVLSSLTSRSRIHTFLRIRTNEGELNFHYGREAPDSLRIRLSQAIAQVDRGRTPPDIGTPTSSLSPGDLVERLSQLAELRRQGSLTPKEYSAIKSRLLRDANLADTLGQDSE